ncbi:UNVERIFIED_CONTAM: hypothetical protein GTU68_016561, partial [Idotea baltica]|nr:hypothetical protein [Idotea baltica]
SIRLLCIAIFLIPLASKADPTIIRIGTGGSAGTYYPIGSLIANAISDPNGLHAGASYNEPELIAIAQRATGSASNVTDVNQGLLEGGLAQADIAHWAFNAKGPFESEQASINIRGIATLYLESVHLVVRSGANINSIRDLKDKRVSLDEQGSGTRLDVLTILEAYGLTPATFKPAYLKTTDAIDRLRKDELDAFFIIAGYPVKAVSELMANGDAKLVPIEGPVIDGIVERFAYFSKDNIPANTYKNTNNISTIGVPAQLIINSDIDNDTAYNITSMLWSPATLILMRTGHPKGHEMRLDSALAGMGIPLHPGAERFYREQGMLND